LEERRQILQLALHNFKGGILFFYFDTLDAIQHMFWRYSDSQSPGYEEDSAYNGTISLYYEKIDTIIGEVLKNLDANTILIVLSDHGFNAFRRSVHLNRWLMDNGYLYLQAGATEGKEFFEGVDWRRTKAYALGFGGIYLNKAAAEYNGTTAKILQKEIMAKIRQLRDPQTDRPVVNSVYAPEDVFSGPYMDIAPDVFVGFNTGYRASWQTALGGVPHTVVEDNQKKWSGDHLIDPVLVPGVVFVNAKTDLKDPSLIDIAPTVLRLFNVIPPEEMKGKVLLKDND
ncbi:MAG: alkaline phosphatase family protein, partial [Candidatus Omnitrophica bacterium]|nr:alkaline phosphatase family protein [Candidatus Omnitrophota bacterium]